MAYNSFANGYPIASQTGPQMVASSAQNLAALRDVVAGMGGMPGWNMAATGGTPEQPTTITYSSGVERVKLALTWGTSGGSNGSVTQMVMSYSSNSGSSYDIVGTLAITYDSNANVTATSWS